MSRPQFDWPRQRRSARELYRARQSHRLLPEHWLIGAILGASFPAGAAALAAMVG